MIEFYVVTSYNSWGRLVNVKVNCCIVFDFSCKGRFFY